MSLDKFRRAFRIKGPLRLESAGSVRGSAIVTDDATRTLVTIESGALVVATKTSSTQTFTLPAATEAGWTFTFKVGNGAEAGEIKIDPAGSDVIQCKATNDSGAEVRTAGGTGIKNTAATNVDGDYITLVADGVITWHTVAQSGIWASQ